MTNLTDRITRLRERKARSAVLGGGRDATAPSAPRGGGARPPERKPATDYFMLFAYALLAASLACQLILILWLDLA